ncbi:MAG: hypothetical protein AAB304_05010, partial [Pseudomonadota bacterium]
MAAPLFGKCRHQYYPLRVPGGMRQSRVPVIPHNRWLFDRIATHILAFEDDSKVVWFKGNFADYGVNRHRRGSTAPHQISQTYTLANHLGRMNIPRLTPPWGVLFPAKYLFHSVSNTDRWRYTSLFPDVRL